METKIIFDQKSEDNVHYRSLRNLFKDVLKNIPESRKKNKIKMVFFLIIIYPLIYIMALNLIKYVVLFYLFYILLGITSVLIFINIIHEAVHNNIFKRRWANNAIIIVFDIIGGNSYIWKKRHISLHHNFQNIAGWDSDIEQAGLIRIYPHLKSTFINSKQHWLIFLLYPMYLLNWVLLRDFKDFFLKNRIIKKVEIIPLIEYFKLLFFKAFFIFYLVVIPVFYGASVIHSIIAFILMLVFGGVFALLFLLTPHANEKNEFPVPDSNGNLNVSWLQHQFITTNDISLNSWFTRNIMGNFNFHLSHHLFPNISSIYAPEITKVIEEYAFQNGFAYKSYGLFESLGYHYNLIKANAMDFNLFEEDM